jgi:hypothetical protein
LQFGYGGALDPERGIAPICLAGVAVGRDSGAGRVFVGEIEVDAAGGYRADLIVANKVILEVKSVERISPLHEAQLLTYVRLSGCRLGYCSTSTPLL